VLKNRKKSSHSRTFDNLRREDYELICNFLVKISSRLQLFIDDMKLSKKFSKPFMKSAKGKNLAGMFLLFRTDLTNTGGSSPTDINVLMDKKIREYQTNKEFITSKRLSEVLRVLEHAGLFLNIENKRDIKKILGYRKVKFKGRPSLYIVPNKIIEINKFLSRPKIRKAIIKYLMQTKLLRQFIYYLIYGFYRFVMQASKSQLFDGFRSVTAIDSKQAAHIVQEYSKVKSILLSCDEKVLDKIADETSNQFLEKLTKEKSELLKRILLLLYELKFD
jgi:hypothetical protein